MKKEKYLYGLVGFILGIIVMIIILHIPRISYDANRDGKITAQDYVVIKNYIMSKDYKGE